MNSYVIDPPVPELDFVFEQADRSSQLFAASRIAAASLVGFLALTEPGTFKPIREGMVQVLRLLRRRVSRLLQITKRWLPLRRQND